MIKLMTAICSALMMCATVAAQERAPLLATCEADVALWYNNDEFTEYDNAQAAFFTDKTPNKTALSRLPVTEVIARHEEMGKCWSMTQRDIYHQADMAYMGIFTDREHDFIVRHNLMQQFKDEDAARKR